MLAGNKRSIDQCNDDDQDLVNASEHAVTGIYKPSQNDQYWMVQWRMPQYKKHKTWDGDGFLVLNSFTSRGTLYDTEGRILTNGKSAEAHPSIGSFLEFGNKEIEIDCTVTRYEFLSIFNRGPVASGNIDAKPSHASSHILAKKFIPLKLSTSNADKRTSVNLTIVAEARSEGNDKNGYDMNQNKPNENAKSQIVMDNIKNTYWTANWRKAQQKKHKTWDGDAYVNHKGKRVTLLSEHGKIMGHSAWNGIPLYSGYQMHIGNRVVEIDREISRDHLPQMLLSENFSTSDVIVQVDTVDEQTVEIETSDASIQKIHLVHDETTKESLSTTVPVKDSKQNRKFIAPTSFYAKPTGPMKGKDPLYALYIVSQLHNRSSNTHDPNAEGAVVMKMPTETQEKKYNLKNRPLVQIVIDPILNRHLRPHQKEGVKFLYECVMGLRKHEGQGCILADEMGLGKTLQTIALVWTLLRQNPFGGGPTVGKVLIVCPVSLVNNWKKEFHKWLGKDRLGIFAGDKDVVAIKQFINSKLHHVLVIGYEKLRAVISELAYCVPPIGLIVCDEGHRLKSANNKTSTMFETLRTPRRIILTGTPMQNDLSEFHAMADFCNPGLLDDYSTFRRVYEQPILKSRTPGHSAKEQEIGELRTAQLLHVSRSFVLRREASILSNYLPPKNEYVLFITPTDMQIAIFNRLLRTDDLDEVIHGSAVHSLALINKLVKTSNSPVLLKLLAQRNGETQNNDDDCTISNDVLNLIPANVRLSDVSVSGKLSILAQLLHHIRSDTDEKCILVSHYTSTLNIIEEYCKNKRYTYLRLDGQTPTSKRQEYVDTFNRSSQAQNFLFLLSAKAGGVGLNLIGASRLCLIDSDWNPSHDLQSMARIHRDGQTRPVYIYRLLTTGTIDEKIYQRQVTKLGLSASMMGSGSSDGNQKSKSDSFSPHELRNIFTIHADTACHTHDLLACTCSSQESQKLPLNSVYDEEKEKVGFVAASQYNPVKLTKSMQQYREKKKSELAALSEWRHVNCLKPNFENRLNDDILQKHIMAQSIPKPNTSNMHDLHSWSLLNTVDLKNFMQDEVSPQHVPKGIISFIFEKRSN